MSEKSDPIWAGKYWGPDGAFLRRERILIRRIEIDGDVHSLSSLASLYYSVAGNAHALWKKAKWKLLWGARALIFFREAERASDDFAKMVSLAEMTADELDVRQTILRCRGRLREAAECINIGISRPADSMKPHTRGLLLIGDADVRLRQGEPMRSVLFALEEANLRAEQASETEPQQAARILRHCAVLLPKTGFPNTEQWAQAVRRRAEELARESGAHDQLLKMGAS